ncbi:MerR family transcriptional regulator [Microtetraspora sp. NBRC 16547]|uniref:MerR family transcriptional regulator n=1 Tax=Microtetraspora sp. NBRC 16547 TaxID=3030993 RepID=UPI0024A17ED1|nr:MerR family transcriptional regulator [Microtetraspora sp. NBRC 16547]GLW99141.1 hypothetical protein Misp02_32280 [Microtetraspora sp. NBRC 16547]
MTIGEIAGHFGLATHVLRHWEAMGLLTPTRVEGSRRRYDHDDLYRVAVIMRAKKAGFTLDDIREMINTEDPAARRDILLRRHAELARRIAGMQASLDLIECALGCDHDDVIGCAHFQTLIEERVGLGISPRK